MANKRGNLGLGALLGTQATDFAKIQPAETVQKISVENIRLNFYDKYSKVAKVYLKLAEEVIDRGK